MDTIAKLDELSNLHAALDLAALQKQGVIEQAIPLEIRQKLADIEAEFAERIEAVNAKIAALEAEIKQDVIAGGASVKAANLQAVYAKGRVSWDNSLLEGLMIAIPQLEKARKIGSPSVSIRRV